MDAASKGHGEPGGLLSCGRGDAAVTEDALEEGAAVQSVEGPCCRGLAEEARGEPLLSAD